MFKGQKGITLVALVITIIVLLILAGVGISMLAGDGGILNYAENAAGEYKNASNTENQTIQNLLNYLKNETSPMGS